jgi:hypothetical protein
MLVSMNLRFSMATITTAVASVIGLVLAGLPMVPANALVSGDTIRILVETSASVESQLFLGDDTIKVKQPVGSVDITGCGVGVHPIQEMMIKNQDGSNIRTNVILQDQEGPLQPGTKLIFASIDSVCLVDDIAYHVYSIMVR